MAKTYAQKEASKKYDKEHIVNFHLTLPRNEMEDLDKHLASILESDPKMKKNTFIRKAISEKINRDKENSTMEHQNPDKLNQ